LNALKETSVDQCAECVVNRLARNRAYFIARYLSNLFSGGVRVGGYRSQNCDALGRDLDPLPAKGFSVVGEISGHTVTLTRSVY
jgi:hypothetical protein